MKKYVLFFTLILSVNILFLNDRHVKAEPKLRLDYNYNFWLETVPNTPAFDLEKVVDVGELDGVHKFGDISDLYVGKERVYIVSKTGKQIVITDHDFNFITRIVLFKNEEDRIMMDGDDQMRLEMPEGVFEAENGDLYVADTGYRDEDGAARIAVFSRGTDRRDREFYYVKNIIGKPSNFIGRTQFIPSKLVVDNAYRIYTIVQGGNEGIIELNADGTFSRYFGVTKSKVNIIDYFWKQLASKEQLDQMNLTFAPPFNNLDIDNDGFIYTTNADPSAVNVIERINPSGINVLREKGYFKPIGDINFSLTQGESVFEAISVNEYGMYAALDTAHGHIFVYNFDGELLFVTGNLGNALGEYKVPSDVNWLNDKLIVSDKKTGIISVLKPTEFGQLVIDATKAYYEGDWEKAGDNWLKAIELNANYDIAYVGYGKMLYMNDRYEEAIKYFKLGNNRTYYSMAYKKYRSEYLRDHFFLFMTPLILLTSWVLYTEYRYNRKGGGN